LTKPNDTVVDLDTGSPEFAVKGQILLNPGFESSPDVHVSMVTPKELFKENASSPDILNSNVPELLGNEQRGPRDKSENEKSFDKKTIEKFNKQYTDLLSQFDNLHSRNQRLILEHSKLKIEYQKALECITQLKEAVKSKNKQIANFEHNKKNETREPSRTGVASKTNDSTARRDILAVPSGYNKKIFLSSPNESGYFFDKNGKAKYDSLKSLYVLYVDQSGRDGYLSFIDEEPTIRRLLELISSSVRPVCEEANIMPDNPKKISLVSYGHAILEGEKWKVKTKVKIFYE
jgi:hypothetical protein